MSAKVYVHYNHTDSLRFARWNARESYEYMYARPWQQVQNFYLKMVNEGNSLSQILRTKETFSTDKLSHENTKIPGVSAETGLESFSVEDKSGRWARVTFKIVLSYHGISFDGWQKQPGLNTVQSLVETSLANFIDDRKAQLLKEKCKPLEGGAFVAGRTDKGVSALQQVCSFYTWRKDVKPADIGDAINNMAPGKLRVVSVSEVSRAFHPNFSAKWRRYMYIFPLNDGENSEQSCVTDKNVKNSSFDTNHGDQDEHIDKDSFTGLITSDGVDLEGGERPRSFSVSRVNQLLQQLEGKLLSYKMFARDTKPSRSIGPATECFLYHARAAEATIPCSDNEGGTKVMCVELVGNRFLRRMVRVLVATSIREAAAGAEDDGLLNLMEATCRRATAPPAPPDGLCLFDVGYTDFDPKDCLIS